MFFTQNIKPPKALADIIESLIAAIFIDSSGRIEECQQVVSSLIFQPYIIPLLIEGTNSIWGVQKHPVSIVHEIISLFNCHQIQFIYIFRNNDNLNNHQEYDKSIQCNIICHNQIISTGYGNNKKRARLLASIQLKSDNLINILDTMCNCHA